MSPTTLAANTLTNLVDEAWTLSHLATAHRDRRAAYGCINIASQLDGARTRLVQEGVAYIDDAWTFIAAARRMLCDYRRQLA